MTTERVHFKLLVTPCCSTMLCWVNPRFPTFCPECGKNTYTEIKGCVTMDDPNATLRYSTASLADYHRRIRHGSEGRNQEEVSHDTGPS